MNNFESTLNHITRKTVEEIEKEIPVLELAGIGGSMKDGLIIHKKLVFNHKGNLDQDRGALLLSKVIDIYLENIYSEKRMEDYLEKHTFTFENLLIVFIIYNNDGDAAFYPDLGYISLVDGFVSYQTVKKSESGIYNVETLRKEPYEDAAKRLGVWKNP